MLRLRRVLGNRVLYGEMASLPIWKAGHNSPLRSSAFGDHFQETFEQSSMQIMIMMLRLQNYHLTVRYKKGKELFVADTLSCAALSDGPRMMQEYNVFRVVLTWLDLSPNLVKLGTMKKIREETVKDPSLMTLFFHYWFLLINSISKIY